MDALFNEEYKEAEKKKQNKSKSKGKNKKKKNTLTKEELQEFDRMWDEMDETCTCEAEETDGFNLDEDFLKECECDKAEEYNQYEGETHCCECDNLDCEMHPMHLVRDTYALVNKDELPMHIGGYLADEILSALYKSLAELIEAKELNEVPFDSFNSIKKNDEIRKILEDTGYKLVHVVDLINASRHNIDENI